MKRAIQRLSVYTSLMVLALLGSAACGPKIVREDPSAVDPMTLPFEDRPIEPQKMARAFPPERVGSEANAWADDLAAAFDGLGLYPTTARTCAAAAVIEEGSNFTLDPAIPEGGALFEVWYQGQIYRYTEEDRGFSKAMNTVFNTAAEGQTESFKQRMVKAKTESELWIVAEDLVRTFKNAWPRAFEGAGYGRSAANPSGTLAAADFFPLRRMGCMQVDVAWARFHHDGGKAPFWQDLYTRKGCLALGAERLLGARARYDAPQFTLADYHATPFASRNAGFQAQITELTGRKIPLDGRLLIYEGDGDVSMRPSVTVEGLLALRDRFALPISQTKMSRDLSREDSLALEETSSWRYVRETYLAERGIEPPYGVVPTVQFFPTGAEEPSPVSWYVARAVQAYNTCLLRMGR